ncbi:MAG: hypothetical protein Q8P72_06860 [Candidatus Roizmanbacteria bacterium]|nr:hypothetical protein [Candidatus Roizmanbacteria bacterium]
MARREELQYSMPIIERDPALNLFMSIEHKKVGGTSMIVGGFGDYYESVEDVIAQISADYPDREKAAAGLVGLGFAGGFKSNSEIVPERPEFFERMGQVGAKSASFVMAENSWDGADILVLASASANHDVMEMMLDELLAQGMDFDSSYMVGQACNSAASAINDLTRLPAYEGARVVVAAIESLSGGLVRQDDYVVRHNFGNVYGAIAFRPGIDISQIVGLDTIIEQDHEGVIQAPEGFAVANKGLSDVRLQARLPHYTFKGDMDEDFFVVTSEGTFLNLKTTDFFTMDGPATFEYFASRVAPIELDMLHRYYSECANQYGNLGPTVAHQPSYKVHSSKNLGVEKMRRRAVKTDSSYDFVVPESPWVMNEMGLNNGSAVTILAPFVHMAKNEKIKPGVPFMFSGFGAGSGISTAVLQLHV